MPRHLFTLFFFCCVFPHTIAAQILQLESAESRAFSGSSVARSVSGALSLNPALDRGNLKQPANVVLAFTPNVQGLPDAYAVAVGGSYYAEPLGLSFSAGASNLSYSTIYSDIDAILGVAKAFDLSDDRHVSVGVRYRYKAMSFSPPYAPIKFNILDLGFAFDATKEFSLGGAALNLLSDGTSVASSVIEQFNNIFLIGATYHPTDASVSLHTSIEEISSYPITLHFGAEYVPVDYLILRAGTSTDVGNINAGAHLQYEQYGIEMTADFDRHYGTIITFGLTGKW